jgi:hypothetical protein
LEVLVTSHLDLPGIKYKFLTTLTRKNERDYYNQLSKLEALSILEYYYFKMLFYTLKRHIFGSKASLTTMLQEIFNNQDLVFTLNEFSN